MKVWKKLKEKKSNLKGKLKKQLKKIHLGEEEEHILEAGQWIQSRTPNSESMA